MRQDDLIKLLEPIKSVNSIGENIITYTDNGATFRGFVQPNRGSLQLKEFGLIKGNSYKIFILKPLPKGYQFYHLLITQEGEEEEHRIINPNNYWKKFTMLITEVVIK